MSQTPPTAALETSPAWEQYLEKNFKKVLILCAAAVAAVCAYGLIQYSNKAKAVKAGEAFTAAKTVDDLDVVIQEHTGSMAAGNALLQKADMLWEQNKKTTSVDALREFTDKYKSHPLYAQTLLAFGSKLESLGNRAEAKAVFERLVSEFATTDVAALAELRLGDILWAEGKQDDAKKLYDGIPAKFPGSDMDILKQGESRAEWIAAKLPTQEVDGPPKPKEEKPAAPNIPGMPQFKLNSADGKALSPTIASPTGGSDTPVINLTPGGASAPISVSPAANMPAAPAAPAPKVPAAATSAPVTVPAVPTETPKPAPAAPASAAPATPAPAKAP